MRVLIPEELDPFGRVRDLPIWSESPRIEYVAGGRTNQNFRVVCGGETFFARIGVDLPHHGVSRTNEIRCAGLAASLGIAPEVVYAADHVLIVRFLDGKTLVQGEQIAVETLGQLSEMLARLHARALCDEMHTFDPATICRLYIDELSVETLTRRDRAMMETILDDAPRSSRRSVIHADVLPENVIDDGSRLWLVDWEYAGAGEPAVDLAIMTMNFDLSDHQLEALTARHGAIDCNMVRAFGPVVALREALWCLVQMQISGARGDLAAYSGLCLRRLGIGET